MASIEVDGLRIPVTVAGHPALDFCNTRAGWGSPAPKEYLAGHRHLTVWARENGLIDGSAAAAAAERAARRRREADAVTARAIAFRDALYAVLVRRNDAWRALNDEIRRAAAASYVDRSGWRLDRSVGLDLPLLAVAWSAAQLLVTPAAGTVSACPMPDCGWIFPNPSGRRRWCSMAMCGNRNKVRRHAARSRAAT